MHSVGKALIGLSLLATSGIALAQSASQAPVDPASDPRISPHVRAFLKELNKDSSPFWELPQPKPQEILTTVQKQTPSDVSGVTIESRTISQDGKNVRIYIVKPTVPAPKPGILFFIHGGVWIAGNFENHKRLVRDLVVGSGQVGVFVDYTSLPAAKYPTQPEECYAALEWAAAHAAEFGADGSRIAIAGNSVGGNMSAAVALMAKDRKGPKISFQVLMIPATDASVDTESYHSFATGRFLPRAFMKYGWDLYAPDGATRNSPYVSPLRAPLEELRGLPPALVITAENDPLRDEGEAYARRLKEAGVQVTSVRFNGMIHDFVLLNALHEEGETKAALQLASSGIKAHLEN